MSARMREKNNRELLDISRNHMFRTKDSRMLTTKEKRRLKELKRRKEDW